MANLVDLLSLFLRKINTFNYFIKITIWVMAGIMRKMICFSPWKINDMPHQTALTEYWENYWPSLVLKLSAVSMPSERRLAVVLEELEVFLEQGQVEEVMMDIVFQSKFLQIRLEKWNIRRYFRVVYRPGGNGIVDWKHQRNVSGGSNVLVWYSTQGWILPSRLGL